MRKGYAPRFILNVSKSSVALFSRNDRSLHLGLPVVCIVGILRNFAFAPVVPTGGSERRGKGDHDEGDREEAVRGRDNDTGKRAIQRGRPQKSSFWAASRFGFLVRRKTAKLSTSTPYGSQTSGLTQGPYLPGVRTADGLAAVPL